MPNLAKKFAPNTEAFNTSQKSNTAMKPHGSDYVDTRSFKVDISQPPYDNTSDPSNVYTPYDTYYGYNVGRVTGFNEEYISLWSPSTLSKNAFMRKGLPFDSFVSNSPLIQHDYDSFTDTYPNAVDSAAAGGQSIKHNGGYWEERNTAIDRDYAHWHREQAYHVVAHSYTTQPNAALRTANDWALGIKIYGSAYLAEVCDANGEQIYDRDILGFNFLEPYDDDGNNPTQTPNIKRLQTKYGKSFSPESYPEFGGLIELVSNEFTGNAYEVALGSAGVSGAVTDVRWVNFQQYTDSPGSNAYPASPVWLPSHIECVVGDIISRAQVIWTPFYLQDPNNANNLLKFYKIDRIELDGLRLLSGIANATFDGAYAFEWSECGTNVYILGIENSALSTNNDAIIARCEIQTPGNSFDWSDLAQVQAQYYPDNLSGDGFIVPSKLNLSRNFQSYKRLNGTLNPSQSSDQLGFTAGVGVYDIFSYLIDGTSNGKSQILSWQASDINNGYSLVGCNFQRDGSGSPDLVSRNIGATRDGWQGADGYQMSWVPSWRNLVHAQRPYEHREIQQMLFGVISAKSYVTDPEGQTSNRYFIQPVKVPATLLDTGASSSDLKADQGKKINVMKSNDPAINEETKYQFFPFVTDTSTGNVRDWDFGSYCSIWSPDGKRFIWFGLSVYDDTFPNSTGKQDPYVNGDPFGYYYSYGDASISPYGLVLYQVECTKAYDISTAQLNTIHSLKMYDDSLSPANPFRGYTAENSTYDGGGYSRLAYYHAFMNPDRYSSSGISGQNTTLYNRKSPTSFGWGVPRKLKWVKSKSYNSLSLPEWSSYYKGYQEFEHGYSLGIIWSGSYGGSNSSSGLYFDNFYNHVSNNNDNRSSYLQNIYTELGLRPANGGTPDPAMPYADVPYDIRDKYPQVVWNGNKPKQLNFRDLFFYSSLYPIRRFNDTTGTTTMESDTLAGYNGFNALTGNGSARSQGLYLADFDFYEDGNRCLVCLIRIAPAYTQYYEDNGTGSSISPNRDYISSTSATEGDGMAIEIWVDLKLTEPYLLTETTVSGFDQSSDWSYTTHKFLIDASDSWFNTNDYQKGARWSYLSATMNPREIKLVNGGRTMLRSAYPGVIQSVTRPRNYWVPSYVNDSTLATDTSLSAQIVKGGGLFGPYSYEKSKRNTQISARRSSILTPDLFDAINQYSSNSEFFAQYVFGYGDSAIYYVNFSLLELRNMDPSVTSPRFGFQRPLGATNFYGSACAFNDDYVVIGCFDKTNAGYTADGAVYVYDRSLLSPYPYNGTQSQALLYTLTSPNPQDNGQFGYSVALKSNYLVVGAPNQDSITVSSKTGVGVVYLFDLSNGSLVRTHENPETGWGNTSWGDYIAGNGERWGQSVGINSTHIAIGAPNQNNRLLSTTYSNIGCIYMFKLSDGSQESNVSIKAFEWTDNDVRFGHHLVMTDTKLVSGTLVTDYGVNGSADAGEIAMYDITQQNIDNNGLNSSVSPFNYEFKISDPNAAYNNDSFFGRGPGSTGSSPSYPFSMTDDFIIVSAYRDATTPRGDGVAYVFSTSGSLAATVLPEGDTTKYTAGNGFGNAVTITDSRFVVNYAGQRVSFVPVSYGRSYSYDLAALQGTYDYYTYYPYMRTMPDTLYAFGELFADDRQSTEPNGPKSICLDPTGHAPVLHCLQRIVRGESSATSRSMIQLKPKAKIVWSD